jgi:hypothetical protein
MDDEKEQDPNSGLPNQDEIDKRIEDFKRVVAQGASEAQLRLKRAVNKASDYFQQVQTSPVQYRTSSIEEQRLRQLVDSWSTENWRVARDLGTYMELVSWSSDEVWELTIETRWETRNMEISTEPYTGTYVALPRPILPIWDYALPPVTGLKAAETRTRLDGMQEIVSCNNCNGTGHVLCSNCTGRGWIVCPDCKGRTKKRCNTCRGRGYVSDWTPGEKKPFFKRQASNIANSLGNKVFDVVDNIRQKGVPLPNPIDTDPASKGPTIPCPDCVNGEVNCSCGNGKRICTPCQGSKMTLCSHCNGTGKLVRHREIARQFDLRTQTHVLGDCPVPAQYLAKSNGDLMFSDEVEEAFYSAAPPEQVSASIWGRTVELVRLESHVPDTHGVNMQSRPRPTLQVVELVRIPYTKLQYRFADQEYELYIYDSEGREKFYAERFPARWDRIERLFKAISNDLLPGQPQPPVSPDAPLTSDPSQVPEPSQPSEVPMSYQPQFNAKSATRNPAGGYRIPVEVPPYSIMEEDEDDEGNVPEKDGSGEP